MPRARALRRLVAAGALSWFACGGASYPTDERVTVAETFPRPAGPALERVLVTYQANRTGGPGCTFVEGEAPMLLPNGCRWSAPSSSFTGRVGLRLAGGEVARAQWLYNPTVGYPTREAAELALRGEQFESCVTPDGARFAGRWLLDGRGNEFRWQVAALEGTTVRWLAEADAARGCLDAAASAR